MTPEIVEPNIAEPKTASADRSAQGTSPAIRAAQKEAEHLAVGAAADRGRSGGVLLSAAEPADGAGADAKKGGKGGDGRAVPVVRGHVAARRYAGLPGRPGIGDGVQHRHGADPRRRADHEGRFQEGQIVKEGDLLVEIDPRPFQVQLEQAEGQMAHDQALLANAKLDLERYQVLLAQEADSQAAARHAGGHGRAVRRRPSRPTRRPSTTPNCNWCTRTSRRR